MEHTITIFDSCVTIRRPHEARKVAEKHRLLLDIIKQPIIFDYEGGWDSLPSIFNGYANSNPHFSDYAVVLFARDRMGASGNIYDFLLSHSVEDEEWTAWRNKELNGIYFRKITFGPELQEVIRAEAERVIAEAERVAEEIETAEREEAERKEAERKALLDGVTWTSDSRTVTDEGGRTKEYKHTLTVNGETFVIRERNIFDFGTVLNWNNCLLLREDGKFIAKTFVAGKGWIDTDRQLDENGQRAAEIVSKYGNLRGVLRM